MRFTYELDGETFAVEIDKTKRGYRARMDDREYDVQLLKSGWGELYFIIDDRPHDVHWAVDGSRRGIAYRGQTFVLDTPRPPVSRGRGTAALAGEQMILAPMPGQVRAVQVTEGDAVEKGQTLALLEAMKMEIRIQAPRAGRVTRVMVQAGQTVDREQLLAEIE